MNRANVGFIGLGDQGAPMAEALIGAHRLYLWARRPETVQPFAGTEAHVMDTAQDVARKVGVLCLAPEEGLGVRDPQMRERHLEAINRFRNR